MTNRKWLALMIAGVVVCIGLICAYCAMVSALFRLWGLM